MISLEDSCRPQIPNMSSSNNNELFDLLALLSTLQGIEGGTGAMSGIPNILPSSLPPPSLPPSPNEQAETTTPLKTKANPNRCPSCRHKLALTDMACRCGIRHCLKHRMPEDHGCTFDFQTFERSKLAKDLVECKADKIGEGAGWL